MPYCVNCGNQVLQEPRQCPNCYYPQRVPSSQSPVAQARPGTSGLAIASLVLGILGLPPLLINVIASILGLVFGLISRSSIRNSGGGLGGGGLATAGIVLGLVGILLNLLVVVFLAAGVSMIENMPKRLD